MDDGSLIRPQMFCDDFTAAIGGVGIRPSEASEKAKSLCSDILIPWTQESGQYWAYKKTVGMAVVVDEYGVKSTLNPNMQLLTERGVVPVEISSLKNTVKALGVYRGFAPEVQRSTNVQAATDKMIRRAKVYTHDAMPLRARKLLLSLSAMG